MKKSKFINFGEMMFGLAGLFILISVYVIYQTGDFSFWVAAKVFYGIGLIFLIKYT